MLEKLEGERMKIMSQPIQNRRIVIYQIQPQFHKEFDRKFQEGQEEREDNEIKHLEFENIKNMLKRQGEEPKFLNRR